jgi:threonine aldolase
MSTSAITTTPSSRAFISDNMAGASPRIARAVADAATGQVLPYGNDPFTDSARRRLGEIFERDVDVFPVSTGSAANGLSLAALTPPWGSVLSHPGSHINTDECGAPEFFTNGAKLVGVPGADSKIDPDALRAAVRRRAGDVHSVQPSAVSISQATESGSVYTLEEIRELSAIAKDAGLRVHMDGARFANALVQLGATPAEMTWKAGVDVLSFGATKNGAMTADAIVSFDPALAGELAFRAKRAGQLASKMRFNTAQIDAYLTDDLWLRNARQANAMATRLGDGLKSIGGAGLLATPQANILFCRLPQPVTEGLLAEGYAFYHDRWEPGIVRFVTAFSHSADDIDQLLDAVRRHTHCRASLRTASGPTLNEAQRKGTWRLRRCAEGRGSGAGRRRQAVTSGWCGGASVGRVTWRFLVTSVRSAMNMPASSAVNPVRTTRRSTETSWQGAGKSYAGRCQPRARMA